MTPEVLSFPVGHQPPQARLYYGIHVLDALRLIPDASVQMVCTSPPYWGLRDYGTQPSVWGGDPSCEHEWGDMGPPHHPGQVEQTKWKNAEAAGKGQTAGSGCFCTRCDAWLGQLGLEPTPEMFVEHLVLIFREVKRVLRPDGILWVNLGDSYFGSSTAASAHKNFGRDMVSEGRWPTDKSAGGSNPNHKNIAWPGARSNPEAYWHLKPKDLVGIPWAVAFALRADGWFLRSDIVWAKPSCMPESVTDRPTKSHEYVFLFSKSASYFYDIDAIREPHSFNRWSDRRLQDASVVEAAYDGQSGATSLNRKGEHNFFPNGGRNRRSVWFINPQPYPGAHFAAWPEELVELMIRAGTSEHGCCTTCGAPWERAVERSGSNWPERKAEGYPVEIKGDDEALQKQRGVRLGGSVSTTVGWEPTCECAEETARCTVLDPFSGSGTTGQVALELGRHYIGIDLNPDYLPLARARILGQTPPENRGVSESCDLFDMFAEGSGGRPDE